MWLPCQSSEPSCSVFFVGSCTSFALHSGFCHSIEAEAHQSSLGAVKAATSLPLNLSACALGHCWMSLEEVLGCFNTDLSSWWQCSACAAKVVLAWCGIMCSSVTPLSLSLSVLSLGRHAQEMQKPAMQALHAPRALHGDLSTKARAALVLPSSSPMATSPCEADSGGILENAAGAFFVFLV